MAATDLLTIDDARKAITLPTNDTTKDADLEATYIPAVTAPVEDVVGPVVQRSFTEWHDGGSSLIRVDYAPIASVTSVFESYGNFTRTLTSQPLSGSSFDAYGYTFDGPEGIIVRRASGRTIDFAPGRMNIGITYAAGVCADTASVPANIRLAARIILAQLWQADQQGFRPQFGAPDNSVVTTPSGFAIPRRAYELLSGARQYGIA